MFYQDSTSSPGLHLLPIVEHYAQLGIATFPIHPGPKVPPAGSHGHKEATKDPDEFRFLLSRFRPHQTVGLAARMGDALAGGGYAVCLDVDEKNGKSGTASLNRYRLKAKPTLVADTRSGGRHFIFRTPAPLESRVGLLTGVDVVGADGTPRWIAVQPTPGYAWRVGPEGPRPEMIAPAPQWLLDSVDEHRGQRKRSGNGDVAHREVIPCPAHRDTNPSLQVTTLKDGRVLLHCFGGCSYEAVALAMDPELAELTSIMGSER